MSSASPLDKGLRAGTGFAHVLGEMHTKTLSIAPLLVCGLLVLGCSGDQSNTNPSAGVASTFAASTAVAPVGPFERGVADPSLSPDPATVGPQITIVSPARGAQITGFDANVEVQVEDPNGVASVEIAGAPAADLGNGRYSSRVPLAQGVNFLDVNASDSLGNTTDSCFSLVQGTFHDQNQVLDRCLAASLSTNGLAKLGPIVSGFLKNISLEAFVLQANPIYNAAGIQVNATAVTHDAPQVSIAGSSGGVLAAVTMTNLRVDAEIALGGGPLPLSIVADEARIIADVAIDPNPPAGGSNLGLTFRSVDVQFTNFRVTSSSGITAALAGLLSGTVQNLITDKLRTMIPTALGTALANGLPGIDRPMTLNLNVPKVGPTSVDVLASVNQFDGSATTGLGMALGLRATATAPVDSAAPTSYFVSGLKTQAVAGNAGDDFSVYATSDAMNGFLHAFWSAGGTRLVIDGSKPDLTKPDPMMLSAKLLYPFLPPVRALAPDPSTPIRIEIDAASAPILRFGQNGNAVEISAGELQVRCLIDYMDGGPLVTLFVLRVPLQLTADVAVTGNEVKILSLDATRVCVDMIDEPAADLADQEVEEFFNSLLPGLLADYTANLPSIPIPALPAGLTLSNARLEASPDVLGIHATLGQ